MAGISYVFTIARVAKMLGENEDWFEWIRKTVVSPSSAPMTRR